MALRTIQASVKDAEEIGALMLSVSTSPRLTLEFKNCKAEDRKSWVINGIRSELAACEACGEGASMLKVVKTKPGEKEIIVGFAIWVWGKEAYTRIDLSRAANPLPEGVNTNLRRIFISSINKMENDHRPKGNCYVLEQLATASSHQRRGIGAQLVKYGLEKADRTGMVCYLSGAPMGVPVYRKLGFEEVGRMEIPLEEFDGSGTHVHVAMVRQPKVVDQQKSIPDSVEVAVGRAVLDDAEYRTVFAPLQSHFPIPMGKPYMQR